MMLQMAHAATSRPSLCAATSAVLAPFGYKIPVNDSFLLSSFSCLLQYLLIFFIDTHLQEPHRDARIEQVRDGVER